MLLMSDLCIVYCEWPLPTSEMASFAARSEMKSLGLGKSSRPSRVSRTCPIKQLDTVLGKLGSTSSTVSASQ